jgi:hypothetical protein
MTRYSFRLPMTYEEQSQPFGMDFMVPLTMCHLVLWYGTNRGLVVTETTTNDARRLQLPALEPYTVVSEGC